MAWSYVNAMQFSPCFVGPFQRKQLEYLKSNGDMSTVSLIDEKAYG